MLGRRLLCCVIATLVFGLTARAQESQLSLAQYINQLEHLQSALTATQPSSADLDTVVAGLPSAWTVQEDSQIFLVSSAELKEDLQEHQRNSKETTSLGDARLLVATLLADARAMDRKGVDAQPERQRLDQILARQEFYSALHESWWERLKREAKSLAFRLLQSMLGSSAFPVVSRVVVWVIAGLAFSLLAWWAVRNYLKSEEFAHFSGAVDAISARPWHDWQAEAKAAAEQGRWRDAIHLSYWSAISFLEGQGLWRPDRARTPREYLRLLPRKDVHRDSLSELTQEFEKTWYGSEAATMSQFVAVNTILGRLGCR
jgi:hypothetical protein